MTMKWISVTLEQVSQQIRNGLNIKQTSEANGLPISRIETIWNQEIDPTRVGYAGIREGERSEWYLRPGDILFSHINSEERIGNCALYEGEPRNLVHGMNLLRITPNEKIVLPKFLLYFIRTSQFRRSLRPIVKRAVNQASVSIGNIRDLVLPLPPRSEQRRIVEILDQADALRKKRAEADAKAAQILPALFYKMFGDPVYNPKKWPIRKLSEIGAQVRYGLGQPPATRETGIPLIRATNISRGIISYENMIFVDRREVPPGRDAFLREGEVIVVRSGAYTGDVAQITKEWEGCVAGYDLVITPGKSQTGEFIEAYLLTPFVQKSYFQNLKTRAGQPHLNAAQLAATPFLDVSYDLQLAFSEYVSQVRTLIKNKAIVKENVERLYSLLLQRAFSGDLTAKWREAHMIELLVEMEEQAKALRDSQLDLK